MARPALATAAALLCFVSIPAVHAESDAMRALAFLEGTWTAAYYAYTETGDKEPVGNNESVYTRSLDGQLLEESHTVLGTGPAFPMRSFYTWDARKKVYRLAAVDQNGGMMDIYEGVLIGNRLVMDNLAHKTFYATADGSEMAFRLNWTFVSDESVDLRVEMSLDQGQSWRDMTFVEMRR